MGVQLATERIGERVRSAARRLGARLLDRQRFVALGILAAILALRIIAPSAIEIAQLRGFDILQQFFPQQSKVANVVIVDIDDASLATLGQWPWPRTLLADLIDKLTAAGTKVIGFDFVFAEADRLSPPRVGEMIRGLDAATRGTLESFPDNDAIMAAAMRRSHVVLGEATQYRKIDGAAEAPPTPTRAVVKSEDQTPFDPRQSLFHLQDIVHNQPVLEAAAKGHGLFNFLPEFDGVVRRVPLALVVGEQIFPALANEMLRVLAGRSAYVIHVNKTGIVSVTAGNYDVPTDAHGRMWVHFSPHDQGRYVSAKDVLSGRVGAERLNDKIVLVGTSAVGLQDLRPTPIDASIPGVEIHAQILETILNGSYLLRPGWVVGAELLLILVLGVTMIALVPRAGAQRTFLILAVLSALIGGGTIYAFAVYNFMLDGTLPLATAGLLYSVLVYMNYAREEAERRQIRSAFVQYLSPAVVAQLAREPGKLTLGGEIRNMSFMFCDIRGFTAISEQFKSNPRGLTGLINRFLTPMTEAIHRQSGTIDKYMGDCVMAFWNAPLDDPAHEEHACAAALDMLKRLETLNGELHAEAELNEGRNGASEAYRAAKQLSEASGVQRDAAKAFGLFLVEAERGYAAAQYNLAKAYRDGAGVARDLTAAAYWFRAAAQQGHAKAQERLGLRYLRGEGVARDPAEALIWLSLAARQGLAAAEETKHGLYAELPPADIAEAEASADAMEPHLARRMAYQLDVGIGINSGECIVGNLGSEQRFDYSVLGDAVNLASRLESLSKDYGIRILVGERTQARVQGFAMLELDLITVKGKREPSRVFGLLGDRTLLVSPEFQALSERHQAMLTAYRMQQWQRARALLAQCRSLRADLSELYDLYSERIEHFEAEPPQREWRGVAIAHRK